MHSRASPQQLLNELAVRERRVLQQLRDLSGMNQSPIPPSRPYESLPVTPERLNTASLHLASSVSPPQPLSSPSTATGHKDYRVEKPSRCQQENGHHDICLPPRGTAGNLERDLQRLQYLLRHSPLTRTQPSIADAGDDGGSEATNAQQPQQHFPVVHRWGGAAVVPEKRTREARRPNLSASPVTPEVKRDRRETAVYYAPPPPLTPFPLHIETPPLHLSGGSTSPARRSAVLDMDEEPRDEDVALASDALAHFSQVAAGVVAGGAQDMFRRVNATMFPGRASANTVGACTTPLYHQPANTVPSEAYSERCAASPVAPSTGAWRRSPVRWFASAAAASTSQNAPRYERCEEAEEKLTTLCVPALDVWAAHHTVHGVPHEAERSDSTSMEASLLPTGISSRASRPPLSPSRQGELSNVDAPLHPALSSASPPPRMPGTSPPLAKIYPPPGSTAGLTFPMPTLDEHAASPSFAATLQSKAATPQPTLHSGGGHHGRSVLAEPQPPCAATQMQRGVMRTTSWYTLKAFYARQSSAGALLTPLWEDGIS
ncbi:hypothetical protein LPMP_291030 [Leishmania panamensis]|uniref:Uncharacterized protein n=1 Tax=Leishmania panamensis TaxID=5679 RepID=A0A088RVJ9_LEIPA|nr:hypothetical protein LPMP_291030 [Leishmania panamensis]AIO00054.1 hypothetical protein LPMP_291030 [Leishmania panamensis]